MPGSFDYTTRARALAFRYPVWTYIGAQVNFWVIAYGVLVIILHFNTLASNLVSPNDIPASLSTALIISTILGVLFGVLLGFVDLMIERSQPKSYSMGRVILIRIITYPILLFGVFAFLRYVLWDMVATPEMLSSNLVSDSYRSWRYINIIAVVYTTFMTMVLSFINQMNRKFGPGVLIPLLLGRYRKPQEQERFFMFLDLKSSTQHAIELGHLKYSAMIRDCFMDINHVLTRNNAEIYQYVGDEVVISWRLEEGITHSSCLRFFFDVQNIFEKKAEQYISKYGFVPEFKAGLQLGIVTAVEIGDVKREIAYHGDTLNTAARIQGFCNRLERLFLLTNEVYQVFKNDQNYIFESEGEINLRGKHEPIEVYSVSLKGHVEDKLKI